MWSIVASTNLRLYKHGAHRFLHMRPQNMRACIYAFNTTVYIRASHKGGWGLLLRRPHRSHMFSSCDCHLRWMSEVKRALPAPMGAIASGSQAPMVIEPSSSPHSASFSGGAVQILGSMLQCQQLMMMKMMQEGGSKQMMKQMMKGKEGMSGLR